jgi:hypothetical protein
VGVGASEGGAVGEGDAVLFVTPGRCRCSDGVYGVCKCHSAVKMPWEAEGDALVECRAPTSTHQKIIEMRAIARDDNMRCSLHLPMIMKRSSRGLTSVERNNS